jgi:tRNA/rRNA methyltransferase
MVSEQPPITTLPGSGIILVGPKYPENIGASARIACNFGIEQLIVVAGEQPDKERMLKMATHKAAHLILNMQIVDNTPAAVEPYHFIVGTTARQGKHRILEQTPHEVMTELAPLAPGSRVALMFGPENSGLTNEDLDLCQFTSTIPTADFSSLNLAQAVAIHCYELSMALHTVTSTVNESDFANSYDLEGMYEHIEQVLTRTTFIRHTNKTYWMRNIRQFLSRTRIKKKEASLIRGACRKFLWFDEQFKNKIEEDETNKKKQTGL